ncbi:hypothetical protein E2562_034986 [Oryza meyeriana var. granulata]|uniref:Uncharacterized protein n=1 Tax=Oryza meyeriana var. granulata TaxID=110450 RepID=A0A6G1CAN2_9ORYZ|nr:hypothetical protein E2562_034986 [Oryza meyeriana var. granulata]
MASKYLRSGKRCTLKKKMVVVTTSRLPPTPLVRLRKPAFVNACMESRSRRINDRDGLKTYTPGSQGRGRCWGPCNSGMLRGQKQARPSKAQHRRYARVATGESDATVAIDGATAAMRRRAETDER